MENITFVLPFNIFQRYYFFEYCLFLIKLISLWNLNKIDYHGFAMLRANYATFLTKKQINISSVTVLHVSTKSLNLAFLSFRKKDALFITTIKSKVLNAFA